MQKKKDFGRYTASDVIKMKSKTNYKHLDNMKDVDIDFSDIPELSDEFWKNIKMLKPSKKEMISLRIDKDILDWFRRYGRGYQGYMNAILKSFVESTRNTKLP